MSHDDPLETSPTLLGRLGADPKDQAAWKDFVSRYSPKILQWCRGWGLQESDAQDVTQNVLMKLNVLMGRFVYNSSGSFRSWLKTLVHHAWRDLVHEQRPPASAGRDGRFVELLESRRAGDDLVEQLEAEFRREVVDKAMERVRPQVAAKTWDAFCLTALDGCSAADAATRLGMKVTRVYGARSDVTRRIQKEVRRLEGGP
jgi:RNA polymerase sigma-70 factor (ECF subfamily)